MLGAMTEAQETDGTRWIIEEYADGELIEQVSCRPLTDPGDPHEPRCERNQPLVRNGYLFPEQES